MTCTLFNLLLLSLVLGVLGQSQPSGQPQPTSNITDVKPPAENITGALNELKGILTRMESILTNTSENTRRLATAVLHNFNCTEKICCPYPYSRVVDECFYVSSISLNWPDARQYCQGMTGDLASPRNLYGLKSFIISTAGLYVLLMMCNLCLVVDVS
nr:uncharacterized protein LOC128699942 [Cherax quadricarinatus]